MLPAEIEPFADNQIDIINDAIETLLSLRGGVDSSIQEELSAVVNQLKTPREAFVRFKICMADEVAQKNRYRTMFLDNRP